MRYLVCVDGSENADAAFERARMLYHHKGNRDELFVLYVFSQDSDHAKKEKDLAVVQKYAKICLANKVNSKMISEPYGMPFTLSVGQVICEKAKEFEVDAIVIGRRGLGAVQRLFAGSVSRYVMENATCDVYIVKGDPHSNASPSLPDVSRSVSPPPATTTTTTHAGHATQS